MGMALSPSGHAMGAAGIRVGLSDVASCTRGVKSNNLPGEK